MKRRDAKGKELESVESVAEFNRNCEETRAWMNDKVDALDQTPDAKDLKALQVGHHPGVSTNSSRTRFQ